MTKILVFGLVAASALLRGQEDPRYTPVQKKIFENTQTLTVLLELDQPEYLAGEIASLKVTVTNNTGAAVEVFRPLDPDHSEGGLEIVGWSGTEYRSPSPSREAQTVWMAAGETVEATVSTDSKDPSWYSFGFRKHSVPITPGEYGARYDMFLRGPTAKFRVLPFVIEQWTDLQFRDDTSRHWRVAIVRSGDERFLIMPAFAHGNKLGKLDPTRNATPLDIRSFSPFRRLVKLESAPTSLEIASSDDEKVVIRWKEGGQDRQLTTNGNAKILERR
jgi:hypothetical protein